jgi:hypothetical protein
MNKKIQEKSPKTRTPGSPLVEADGAIMSAIRRAEREIQADLSRTCAKDVVAHRTPSARSNLRADASVEAVVAADEPKRQGVASLCDTHIAMLGRLSEAIDELEQVLVPVLTPAKKCDIPLSALDASFCPLAITVKETNMTLSRLLGRVIELRLRVEL